MSDLSAALSCAAPRSQGAASSQQAGSQPFAAHLDAETQPAPTATQAAPPQSSGQAALIGSAPNGGSSAPAVMAAHAAASTIEATGAGKWKLPLGKGPAANAGLVRTRSSANPASDVDASSSGAPTADDAPAAFASDNMTLQPNASAVDGADVKLAAAQAAKTLDPADAPDSSPAANKKDPSGSATDDNLPTPGASQAQPAAQAAQPIAAALVLNIGADVTTVAGMQTETGVKTMFGRNSAPSTARGPNAVQIANDAAAPISADATTQLQPPQPQSQAAQSQAPSGRDPLNPGSAGGNNADAAPAHDVQRAGSQPQALALSQQQAQGQTQGQPQGQAHGQAQIQPSGQTQGPSQAQAQARGQEARGQPQAQAQAQTQADSDATATAVTVAAAQSASDRIASLDNAVNATGGAAPAGQPVGRVTSGTTDSNILPNLGFVAANAVATATATPAAAAGTAVPISGLAVAIAAHAQAGSNRFDIRLDPPELGRIDVRLAIDSNGQVTSHVTVDRPDTLQLLQSHQPQLERAFEQAGLKTADNGLQFTLRDQSFAGQSGNGGNSGGQSNAAQLVVPDAELAPVDTTAIYSRASLGSGLDIRV